jgi:hypothetical protein
MTAPQILAHLRARANPDNVTGMARYGINTRGTLGVPVYELRALARRIGATMRLPPGSGPAAFTRPASWLRSSMIRPA